MTNAVTSEHKSKKKKKNTRRYLFLPVALVNQSGLTENFLLTFSLALSWIVLVSTHIHQTGSAFPLLDLLVMDAKSTGIEYI